MKMILKALATDRTIALCKTAITKHYGRKNLKFFTGIFKPMYIEKIHPP